MLSLASQAGPAARAAPGPDGPARTKGLVARRARLRGQIETMRRGGMSPTAVRRALGLTSGEAVAAGIVAPTAPAAAPQGGQGQEPEAAAPVPGAHASAEADRNGPPRLCAARSPQGGPAMASVLEAVARVSGVAPARLLGPGQDRALARPRHLTMYLLRELCAGASLPAIGHFLGRDHTTVLYGCRRAAALVAHDAEFRDWHARALSVLGQGPAPAPPGRP